jgi:23S rRNA pseudouridine1911/1915/1917 synthase
VIERRGDIALVEARLTKGRAHQVRAHLAYIGAPVVGDEVYGDADAIPLRLHAVAVSLLHPRTGQALRIEAPLPAWAMRHT